MHSELESNLNQFLVPFLVPFLGPFFFPIFGLAKNPIRLARFFGFYLVFIIISRATSPRPPICRETAIQEQMFFWQNSTNSFQFCVLENNYLTLDIAVLESISTRSNIKDTKCFCLPRWIQMSGKNTK